MQLVRRFNSISLLMLSINGMIGSAWLFAPLYAAKIAGPAAIIAWIIAGFATMVIAFTFAELSVLFPIAGGTAQLPNISHGALNSFIIGWVAWLSALTMAPIEVQAILQYASFFFPSLMVIKHGVPVLSHTGLLYATLMMLAFCFINLCSFQGFVRCNFVIFTFKVLVIILAIVAFISTQFVTDNFSGVSTSVMSVSGWHAILTAVATGGVAFAFTGFKHGVELAGETTNLSRAIPIAIVGSILCCLLLYLGLQIAFIGALSPIMLVNGWHGLTFAGDVGPFAGLAAGLGLMWLVKLLYLDALVSPTGAGLIYVTSTARILYAMSEIGYVPKWLGTLNKHHFPIAAIAVNFILGMFLFLPLPGWQAMVSFLVSGMVLSYAMGPIALLSLRLEKPAMQRQFKLSGAYLVCPLAFYFCNLLSYWTGWETIWKLAIAISIGIVLFVIAAMRGQIKSRSLGLKSVFWLLPYLTGLVLISYLGSFGGKNIIPFGWDFAVIALFSVVILYMAVCCRLKQGR